MEQLLPFIHEVGFPVVVTLYLLHRIETKLDGVIDSIQMLPQSMKADPTYEMKKNIL
ncbi:YvrJ family protein [Bacillus sp. REN16]|uniref:YvrJ family protein n=1 Tax=Bacillus sp. REN16 TaxID=2887296 RepID=UPI001E3F2858|nr:YvrJ family protein [Bacillus sp. REN16]MCC3357736.1 YvrJ family protein [Bacillus sp. REN16]